ncbi:hypothetical protein SUGI_0567930 [Cryptomeria japonica]|nr:hypothetical protein SUGI_0567820 [Cryptomeria japonica]GLJ28808.1 hypothetical protein SUGI_0567930 [Cryptomeria japonica]
MVDLGFIPGFIGYAIQLAGDQLIHHINVAVRCRKELDSLRDQLPRINEMNLELQRYQKALNSGKVSTSSHALPSTVNSWLNKLSELLEEASDLAERCTVPSYFHPISRYTMSTKIRQLTANLEKHVEKDVATVAFLHQLHQDVSYRQGFERIERRMDSLKRTAALAGTSGDLIASTSSAVPNTRYIEEALIVGQDSASNELAEMIHSQQHKKLSRFGLVGKGGADDVWETSASCLLEELCVPLFPQHKSNIIIATSRSNSVLSQLGAPNSSIIQMQDLSEDESWSLYSFHAFPDSDGMLPGSIDEGIARRVCKQCGGFR